MPGALVDVQPIKQANVTFKRAPRARAHDPGALELPLVHRPAKSERAAKPARPDGRKK